MKASRKIQSKDTKAMKQPKPQSNQSVKPLEIKQITKISHQQKMNSTNKESFQLVKNQQLKTLPKESQQQKQKKQAFHNNTNILSGEQKQRTDILSKINFQQVFASKKLYKPISQLNQSFTQSIGKGIVSVNTQEQGFMTLKNQLICFKKQDQQKNQNFLENSRKVKEIEHKKNQILDELKLLYQDQQKLRSHQKLIFLNKKVHHQFVSNHRNQEKQQTSLFPQNKTFVKMKKTSPDSLTEIKSVIKTPQQKSKSLPKSTFTEQQKKKINQIIKNKHRDQILRKEKLQKLFDQLNLKQRQLLQKQKLSLDIERQKRKQKALERLNQQKNSRLSFIISSRKRMYSQPQQTKDNEFFSSDLSNTPNTYSLSRLNLSPKRNYSYLNYKRLDQEKLSQQAQNYRLILQKKKQQTKLNFQEIKIHLKNYKSIKTQQTQTEKQKFQNFKLTQIQRVKQIRQKYGFMTKIKETILDEEKKQIEKYQNQINRKINYQKRMKNYFYSISNKPKPRSKSSFLQGRTIKTNSEKNIPILSSKSLYQNEESFEFEKNGNEMNKRGITKQKIEEKATDLKIDKEKLFLSEALQLSRISHDALTKRKIELKQNIQRKQREMIKILRKDESSLKDIKKALEIFHQLDNLNETHGNYSKRKTHKKGVAW